MFYGLSKNISVKAMIDSGASSSFVYCNFVKENKIKTITLPSPYPSTTLTILEMRPEK
jgi:hypothetical protein